MERGLIGSNAGLIPKIVSVSSRYPRIRSLELRSEALLARASHFGAWPRREPC